MSQSEDTAHDDPTESIYRDYVLDVRIVECETADGTVYRFEAPFNAGMEFDDPGTAELYADVYFDVNGFDEDGVGERGVPPEIVQAGRDTLSAYFLTQRYADLQWVASFYGKPPEKIQRYVDRVRRRAESIREGAVERGVA
ncbi:MAG: hypothetical protein ABEI80_07705 [Haloplanus sp.]